MDDLNMPAEHGNGPGPEHISSSNKEFKISPSHATLVWEAVDKLERSSLKKSFDKHSQFQFDSRLDDIRKQFAGYKLEKVPGEMNQGSYLSDKISHDMKSPEEGGSKLPEISLPIDFLSGVFSPTEDDNVKEAQNLIFKALQQQIQTSITKLQNDLFLGKRKNDINDRMGKITLNSQKVGQEAEIVALLNHHFVRRDDLVKHNLPGVSQADRDFAENYESWVDPKNEDSVTAQLKKLKEDLVAIKSEVPAFTQISNVILEFAPEVPSEEPKSA